jgi:hypothetical protein
VDVFRNRLAETVSLVTVPVTVSRPSRHVPTRVRERRARIGSHANGATAMSDPSPMEVAAHRESEARVTPTVGGGSYKKCPGLRQVQRPIGTTVPPWRELAVRCRRGEGGCSNPASLLLLARSTSTPTPGTTPALVGSYLSSDRGAPVPQNAHSKKLPFTLLATRCCSEGRPYQPLERLTCRVTWTLAQSSDRCSARISADATMRGVSKSKISVRVRAGAQAFRTRLWSTCAVPG